MAEKESAVAEAAEKAKSSEEIDELNGQIAMMQEVIDSKDKEIDSLKKVGASSRAHE